MNRLTLALVAIAATASGLAASLFTVLLLGAAQPEPVQAAPEATAPIRIAVVNLEEVSRSSRLYAHKMWQWKSVQDDVQKAADRDRGEYEAAIRRLNFALSKGEDKIEIQMCRIEVQAYEESLAALQTELAEYLQKLLDEYQREVLKDVLDNVRRYARQEGFQLVLQDYTLDESNAKFTENDYAETLMAKPVVDAPGMSSDANTHVTDITKIMIDHMRKGGVPEKDD